MCKHVQKRGVRTSLPVDERERALAAGQSAEPRSRGRPISRTALSRPANQQNRALLIAVRLRRESHRRESRPFRLIEDVSSAGNDIRPAGTVRFLSCSRLRQAVPGVCPATVLETRPSLHDRPDRVAEDAAAIGARSGALKMDAWGRGDKTAPIAP
jgi:hypothetical protein